MLPRLAAATIASAAAAAGPLPAATTIEVGGQPTTAAVGAGGLWLANYGDGTIDRIDVDRGKVDRRLAVAGQPYGVAIGGGAVWASSWSTRYVSRIDPSRRRVVARIDVGSDQQAGMLVTKSAVWVAVFGAGVVVRIDPATNKVVGRIRLGGKPESVASSAGSLWVPNEDGTLARIDPRSNRVLRRIRVGADPDDVVVCGGRIWTTDLHGPNLLAVDPRSNTVTARVRVGVGSKGLACGRSLWTANYDTGEVLRVSLGPPPRISARAPVGSGPRAVSLAGRRVWVANQLGGSVSVFAVPG